MDASGLQSFVYSINFQIRLIMGNIFPGNNNRFKIFEKIIIFASLKSPYHRLANRTKLILPLILLLFCQNIEGHDHWYYRHITFESFTTIQNA